MNYTIYRQGTPIAVVKPTGQQEREIMTKDIVSMSFTTADLLDLRVGDYVDVWGSRYELAQVPSMTKDNAFKYQYECTFVAHYYKLGKWKCRGYDSANALTLPEWELMGALTDFAEICVANANRMDSGWSVGDLEENAVPQLLNFTSENNILLSLDQIARAFRTEWWVVGKVIHFIKRQEVSGHEFEYGYDKGLRGGISRTGVDTSNVFSRLFAQGSEANLPATYRNGQKRLQLPIGTPFLQGTKYGPDEIENDIVFDDIRPERIGTVTSVGDMFTFSDSGIDFDLNEPGTLLPGLSAKVSFLTGNLAGYNFEIQKGGYNHSTKTIRIITNELEKGNFLPDADRKPEVGDTYFIFDIAMPDSYVTDAQNRLLTAATAYMAENGSPKFAYEVPPDHFFFERNSTLLTLGDTVHVKELDLLLNKDIRIVGYVRDLHDEFRYTSMSLSDFTPQAAIVRRYAEAEKTKKALLASKVYDIQRARNNWKTTSELTTLLDTVKAEMLLIMMDGGSYSTDIVPTTTETEFSTTAGQIVHEQYTTGPQNGIWSVTSHIGTLVGTGAQYVYIRASTTANTAIIVLSPTKIGVEDVPGVYHFPYGVISSVIDSDRTFTRLYGRTAVTGGQVATGEIVSNNGQSNINLDNGTFSFENLLAKIAFTEDGIVLDGLIVADNAEFVGLVVQNLRTGDTGMKRIVIDAIENNIRLYDAFNQILIEADDDSALESITISGGVPTYNYGPGLKIGISPSHAAGQSTIGRKGIYTNGFVNTGSIGYTGGLSEMSELGFKTTGAILDMGAGIAKSRGRVPLTVTRGVKLQDAETSGIERVYSMEIVDGLIMGLTYVG